MGGAQGDRGRACCGWGPVGGAGFVWAGPHGSRAEGRWILRAGQSRDCSLCPQEGHFGFEACEGCHPCACGPAAESSECHPQSGQCHCRPGTGGPQCRECAPGHWGLPEQGCRRECEQAGYLGMASTPRVLSQLLTLPLPPLLPKAASARGATVTCTRAAARALLGSVGNAVRPAATSTRCPCQEDLGATACTVKVCPCPGHRNTPCSPCPGAVQVPAPC